MTQLRCDYHPKRDAVDKCQRCNRLICLEDKQTLSSLRSARSSFFRNNGGIYCSSCYYEVVRSLSSSPFSKSLATGISVIILVFFGGFLLLFNFVLGVESEFLTYFFGGFILLSVMIIWFVYFITSSISSGSIDLDRAREAHFKLVETQQPQESIDQETDYQFCMHCGATIEDEIESCRSCGEPLHPAK